MTPEEQHEADRQALARVLRGDELTEAEAAELAAAEDRARQQHVETQRRQQQLLSELSFLDE